MPRNKAIEKKLKEKKLSDISRRDMLKMGAAAGAVTILGPTLLTSKKSLVFAQGAVAEPVLCAPTPVPVSPATTPFLDNLPIPLPAVPQFLSPTPTENANTAGGEAARAPHQRWAQLTPAITYQMEAKAATHQFHSNLLPSYAWAFNGKYPAPTVLNAYGLPSIVRFKNSLPTTTTSFGTPEITIHLHNGHTSPESDGFAQDFFAPGLFKDNHYGNIYAGLDDFGGIGDPREAMHTFWFHDHHAGETANNNYLGLNGMYFVYDEKDPGHEFSTPDSLRLPNYYGITDIPLILTEKRFCAAANGRNEMFQVVGNAAPAGDKWVVNGKIQPKFAVRRRKYRFRILNTGPAKTFNLSLIKPDGTQGTITVVAVDANFLEHPFDLSTRTLDVFVAMRFDVIIDFAAFPVGTSVYLKENAPQNVTGGGPALPDPAPGLPMTNVLMRFDVVGNTIIPDTPPVPADLVEMPDPPVPDGSFEWRFTLEAGQFKINGLPFDPNRVDHAVLKGSTEEWTLRNNVLAGNWVHPVHIHFEEGRIQSRTTRPDPVNQPGLNVPVTLLPEELGRRDVYPLPGQHTVVLRQRFRDFVGRYLIHCHNMNHEDNFMMMRWDIVETLAQLREKRREIAQRRAEEGVAPIYSKEELG
ncbi:MAG TPA: multicopper oxidase domain-containing protein [Blastocatellia bacterium]|nr:multicopper oxidase domain-containing protein [Blastocatellia bacterium]